MEALAALSVVCNVIQLIDASVALAKAITQIRKNGSLEDNAESQQQAQQLQAILSQLKKQDVGTGNIQDGNPMNMQIRSIATNCEMIARELCAQLDSLKSQNSRIDAAIAGFRAMRNKNHTEKLKTKLRQHRELLTTTILVALREEVRSEGLLRQSQLESLDIDLQSVLHNSKTGFVKLEKLIESLGIHISLAQQRAADGFQKELADMSLNASLAITKRQLLDSLTFPDMFSRNNQIAENEPGTFEWIFDQSPDNNYTTSQLCICQWLELDKSFFWIQGKAGSGKSTLMKFLWDSSRTADTIKTTYASNDCVILKYSFWLAGTVTQRSIEGCYMSLLQQLLSLFPDTLSIVLHNHPYLEQKRQSSDWSERELRDLLLWTVGVVATSSPVALFIDGLDEIAERQSYPQILNTIKSLTAIERIKVCVSSRPESYWLQSFAHEDNVQLQDLVFEDIKTYVKGRLADHNSGTLFTAFESDFLCSAVAHKAEGVFLWARLAINHLLQALDGLASSQEVIELVDALPISIEGMYEKMLTKQGAYSLQAKREAAVYFKAILSGVGLHLVDFAAFKAKIDGQKLMEDQYSLYDLYHSCEKLQTRIPHICGGMVQCTEEKQFPELQNKLGTNLKQDPASVRVEFIHRTVMDFLIDTKAGQELIHNCSISDDEILQGGIEMPLKNSSLHKRRLRLLDIVLALEKMTTSSNGKLLQIKPECIAAGIQLIVDALPRLEKIALGEQSNLEQSPDISMLLSDGQLQYQIFDQMPSKDVFWYDGISMSPPICYLDIIGCSLAHGLCDYAELITGCGSQIDYRPSVILTQSFKNYLLFCAIVGCQRTHRCISFAIALIDAGADPFAELFLPTWEPRKVCAAAQLICIRASSALPHVESDFPGWDVLCLKVRSALPKDPVVTAFSVVVWPTGSDVALPAFPSSQTSGLWDVGFLIEADTGQLLRELTHVPARQKFGRQSFPMFMRARKGNVFLARFNVRSDVRSHKSVLADTSPLASISDRQLAHIESEFDHIFGNKAISSFAAWSKFQDILQELYKSELTISTDCKTWQKEHGYIIDESDPRLFRGPITRFEHLSDTNDTAGKLSQLVDSDDGESSYAGEEAFFDAEE